MSDHKAYVQSWAKAISNDKNILISAIFDAEKIADYVEDKAELTKVDPAAAGGAVKKTIQYLIVWIGFQIVMIKVRHF